MPLMAPHTWPQAPQLLALSATEVSQPSLTRPLQSSKPASQAPMEHAPAVQRGVAWAPPHTRPQSPQFITSLRVLVSQPSWTLPLQSSQKPRQVSTVQLPPTQPDCAWGTTQ